MVDQVVAVPVEVRMLGDAHEDVQVAGAAAALAGVTLAREADTLPVGDAGGDLDRDGLLPGRSSPTGAAGTRLPDDLPLAATTRAGATLDELAEGGAADGAQLARTPALGAGGDRRRVLGARAAAVGAGVDQPHGDLGRQAERRLPKVQVHGDLPIAAPSRTRARRPPAAEDVAAEERLEDVGEVGEPAEAAGARSPAPRRRPAWP